MFRRTSPSRFLKKMVNTIKVKTKYGRLLTIKIQEQTDEFISGFDKFGIFTKVLISDIESCEPIEVRE